MTMYRCIRCETDWEKQNGDTDSRVSGSLCGGCLRESLKPLYKKRQRQEGNFDCFGTAFSDCDQIFCLYRKFCLREG